MNHSGYISPWFPVYVFAIIIVALLLFKNSAGKKSRRCRTRREI